MPLFSYKAVREDGSTVNDELTAATSAAARETLRDRGFLVLELRKKGSITGDRGASAKEFLIFNQEFVTLVKAGLPIMQALDILQHRMEKKGFRSALTGIREAVRGGTALSDALAAHPAYFPPLYTSAVRAGEQSGALVDVLKRYIEYQKRMLSVRTKVRNALFYPLFLVIVTIAVLTLFFLYIIPNFTQMYSDQAGSLPVLTRVLIIIAELVTDHAPLIALTITAAITGILFWQRTDRGGKILDAIKLRVPLVRSLLTQYLMAQLTRTLATVLRGGIPLVQALETTASVIGNQVIGRRLVEARSLVIEGVSLADAFERTRLAPDMTVRMIEVGESSGDLPQMLEDVADFYEQEVENRMANITSMIEPVLMLAMGIVIAFIVVALYLPIFEMGARLQ